MWRKLVGSTASVAAASVLLVGCGGTGVDISDGGAIDAGAAPAGDGGSAAPDTGEQPVFASGRVCVVLPNLDPTDRWGAIDKPALEAAFTAAGVDHVIESADDDAATFTSVASDLVANGCSALVITTVDAAASQEVISNAQLSGVSVIDYDRLSVGGLADYVVMTDPAKVGTALGAGLGTCLKDAGTASGKVTLLNDGDATLADSFTTAATKAGYTPDVAEVDASDPSATGTKGAVGVAAADDAIATAVAEAGGKAPLAGQGTTVDALQRVLLGTQCMTVFSEIDKEADLTAQLAGAVAVGDLDAVAALTTGVVVDPETSAEQPAALVDPISVFPDTVKDVVASGRVTTAELCTTPELTAACTKYGVQ